MRLDIQRFASGTIDGSSTASRCDCQIVWSSTSNGSSANSSNVTATIQILKTGSGTTTGTFSGTITINGTNYNVSKKFSPYTYGNWATVGSATAIVPHNDNGTKTITISGKLTQSGTTMAGTYTANGSATLDTIPRASTLISTSGNTLGSGMSVTYNSKANFTTKAFFKFANSGWDYVGELWGSGDKTIYFTPSIDSYAPYCTTANNSTAYIKIITYDGATQIGEEVVSGEFNVNIPIQNPSITGINITDTTGLKNTYGSYIKGKSICRVEANASGIYGSWITSYSITIGTSNGSNQALETVTTIAGERPIRVRVTDSRGNSVEQTSSINVLDYQNPSIYTLTAERNNENESIINVNFSGGVTTLDGNNSAYFTLKYKQTSQSSWTTYYTWSEYNPNKSLIIEGIDSNSSYEILLEANDNFSNSTKTVQVGTSFSLINFSSGGRGMAIGKASESENLFEVGMNMNVTEKFTTSTWENNNTIDTWVPVWKDGYLEHRVIPAAYNNDPSTLSVGTATNVNGGSVNCNSLVCSDTLQSVIQFDLSDADIAGNFRNNIMNGKNGLRSIRNEKLLGCHYMPAYGNGVAFSAADTQGFLYTAYNSREAYVGGGNGNGLLWVNRLAFYPEILFDNMSGTDSNITWGGGEPAGNFRFMEIFYTHTGGNGAIKSVKVPYPNQKSVQLDCQYDNGTYLYFYSEDIYIENYTIIRRNKTRWRIGQNVSATRTDDAQCIKIVQVLGYR